MLNLYDILQEVLTESISSDDINNAIDNKYQVVINYNDEYSRAPGKRIIEPYAYGVSKSGNEVLRAFQYNGDTYRGTPEWKLFRLDRISSWQPTQRHFNIPPNENGWTFKEYNKNGDKTMDIVFNQVHFDNDTTDDTLSRLRRKTKAMKDSAPININDLQNNSQTVNNNTINSVINTQQQDYNSDEFQKMLQKNLETTKKEKNKRGFSLSNSDEHDDELPVVNKDISDTMNDAEKDKPIINNTVKSATQQQDYNSDEFQKMLQRNLETTKKEKNKRGFSL